MSRKALKRFCVSASGHTHSTRNSSQHLSLTDISYNTYNILSKKIQDIKREVLLNHIPSMLLFKSDQALPGNHIHSWMCYVSCWIYPTLLAWMCYIGLVSEVGMVDHRVHQYLWHSKTVIYHQAASILSLVLNWVIAKSDWWEEVIIFQAYLNHQEPLRGLLLLRYFTPTKILCACILIWSLTLISKEEHYQRGRNVIWVLAGNVDAEGPLDQTLCCIIDRYFYSL